MTRCGLKTEKKERDERGVAGNMPSGDPLAPLNSLNAVQWRASVRPRVHQRFLYFRDCFLSSFYSIFHYFILRFSLPRDEKRKDDGAVKDEVARWMDIRSESRPDAAGENVLIRWKPLGGKLVWRRVAFERRVASAAFTRRSVPFRSVPSRSRRSEQDVLSTLQLVPATFLSFFLIGSFSSATVATNFLPEESWKRGVGAQLLKAANAPAAAKVDKFQLCMKINYRARGRSSSRYRGELGTYRGNNLNNSHRARESITY